MDEFFKPFERPLREHLVRPGGGLSAEIHDLREDISSAFGRVKSGTNSITTESMQVWANGTSGDDENDGLTEATAKKTILAAHDALPDVIKHSCTIHLRGTFTNVTTRIQKILAGGLLIIDGGPETEVLAGPFTSDIASTSGIGDSGQAWTTDEHAGAWVEILDGPAAGETRQIRANDGTTLTPADAWSTSPGVGASFQISQPATKLSASSLSALTMTCLPQNTYQNYPAVQRVTLTGQQQIYHVGGSLLLTGVVSRSTYSPGYRSESSGVLGLIKYLTDPETYSFVFVGRYWPTHIGSGGLHLLKSLGQLQNYGFILNGGSASFESCKLTGVAGESRVIGGVELKNAVGTERLKISGASGVGLKLVDSSLESGGLAVDGCGSHGIEVDGGRLTQTGGGISGSGNGGAGAYAHSHGTIHTKAGTAPTVTGVVGDVSLDGSSEESTWASVEAGTPINGATVGNDEFVIVKRT